MVGSGKIGTQPTADVATLPGSQVLSGTGTGSNTGSGTNSDQSHDSNAAAALRPSGGATTRVALVGASLALAVSLL